jgi:replicative DNA helicase
MTHSPESEQSVLGSILIDNNVLLDLPLKEKDFFDVRHQLIFRAIKYLNEHHVAIDTITLNSQLKSTGHLEEAGGSIYLTMLTDVATAANVAHYADIVLKHSKSRKIVEIANRLSIAAERDDPDELIHTAVNYLNDLQVSGAERPYIKVGDIVREVAHELIEKKPEQRGIPTYLEKVDRYMGSMEKGDLIVIAGRPSMGKTALALSMLYKQAKNNYRVGMITMDMSEKRLTRRLLCHENDTDLSDYVAGEGQEPQEIIQAAGVLYNLPIFIADAGKLTVQDLEKRVKLMVRKDMVDIIYVDYLQQIAAKGTNREQEVARASITLKSLAKDLNIPIVALAQLNRKLEERIDKRPRLSDLRESGQIEQDAEVILFPYRDEVYNDNSKYKGQAEIIFGKTRDSGAAGGSVFTAFLAPSMRFADLSQFDLT